MSENVPTIAPKNTPQGQEGLPSYLPFLRIFAALSFVIGILASLAFLVTVLQGITKASYEPGSFLWLIALCLAIEGYLAYGLLNAVADIAENMIEVGKYVRHITAVEKHKLQERKSNE